MNMDAGKTDGLIAKAIAALPYKRPSPGFAAGVMAQISVEPLAEPWQDYALKAAGFAMAAWMAAIAFISVRLVYANLPEIAAFLIQPGGVAQVLNLLAAKTALAGLKLAAAASFAADLAAVAGFPDCYEIAVAAVICAGAVYAVSVRTALQKI